MKPGTRVQIFMLIFLIILNFSVPADFTSDTENHQYAVIRNDCFQTAFLIHADLETVIVSVFRSFDAIEIENNQIFTEIETIIALAMGSAAVALGISIRSDILLLRWYKNKKNGKRK
jgi:hypothetical protein